jgi:hypothetical protein
MILNCFSKKRDAWAAERAAWAAELAAERAAWAAELATERAAWAAELAAELAAERAAINTRIEAAVHAHTASLFEQVRAIERQNQALAAIIHDMDAILPTMQPIAASAA